MSDHDSELPDKIKQALKASPAHIPPERFYQSVLRRVDHKREPRWILSPWPKWIAATCVIMLGLVVVRQKTPMESLPAAPVDRLMKVKQLSEESKLDQAKDQAVSKSVGNKPGVRSEEDRDVPLDLKGNIAGRGTLASPAPAAPQSVVMEARDPSGVSSQFSYLDTQRALAGARAKKAVNAAEMQSVRGSATTESTEPALDLWRGSNSGIHDARTVVIRDASAWQRLWEEHTQGNFPKTSPPNVDFMTQMVVAVFAGDRPTTGYEMEITDVKTLSDQRAVEYREKLPPYNMAAAQMITQPYAMKVIPRTSQSIHFQPIHALER